MTVPIDVGAPKNDPSSRDRGDEFEMSNCNYFSQEFLRNLQRVVVDGKESFSLPTSYAEP